MSMFNILSWLIIIPFIVAFAIGFLSYDFEKASKAESKAQNTDLASNSTPPTNSAV